MQPNYTMTTKCQAHSAAKAAPGARVMLDGLEDRTFFAAAPSAMPTPHMVPQAVAVEVVPVVVANGMFGRPQVGFEVIVIREQLPVFAPHGPIGQPPAFGDGDPEVPPAASTGGDSRQGGGARVVTSPQPSAVTSAMQTVVGDSWDATALHSNNSVVTAGQEVSVTVAPANAARTIDAGKAADFLKLDSDTSPGLWPAVIAPVAPVEGSPQLPGGMMASIVAAFPPSLSSWMTSSARPLEQAVMTLTSMIAPATVGNVFSAASPSEFLKAAAPGLAAALSTLGTLTAHVSVPGVDTSAWQNAAVVGVGLAAAGYGYSALQRRKSQTAEAAAAAQELARKEWDLQPFEER